MTSATSPAAPLAADGVVSIPAFEGFDKRHFCPEGVDPFDTVTWGLRDAVILDYKTKKPAFEQKGVEFPVTWTDKAVGIVASKYFYGKKGSDFREHSLRQLIHRVADTIARHGLESGYFTKDQADNFYADLAWLCLHQYGAFNSPVWFNVGVVRYGARSVSDYRAYRYDPRENNGQGWAMLVDPMAAPQASACFICSIPDSIRGLWETFGDAAALFKYGSGYGGDWSPVRSSHEFLSGGGTPSGPVDFARVLDATGGTMKSGGRTRRAAIMITLKDLHPDVDKMIEAKPRADELARMLMAAGVDGSIEGEAYRTVPFQNTNISIRLSDEFVRRAQAGQPWNTRLVTSGQPGPTYDASHLLDRIAAGTWACGDPGVQYEDTIQDWHTCPNTGAINSSNPCSEFMFLDDTACNLASLNLLKFLAADGAYEVKALRAAVRVFFTAQEILVGLASYPSAKIAVNSYKFRPLGLGPANLGGLLMSMGIPYDSADGRAWGGALMAVLTGEGYRTSAYWASRVGPFDGYAENREPMLRVIGKHRERAEELIHTPAAFKALPAELLGAVRQCWQQAQFLGEEYGYRNSQATVCAPTGTISFQMDCDDSTGIEPCLGLVTYKTLIGGGAIRIVNKYVPRALRAFGLTDEQVDSVSEEISETGSTDTLRDDLQDIFLTSLPDPKTGRCLPWKAHVDMMAALQPFVSGAISKTINMPESATVKDIREAYLYGHARGLKALAIYRDGSKGSQPVTTKKAEDPKPVEARAPLPEPGPVRRKLPKTRRGVVHSFQVGDLEGYIIPGEYPDGSLGEVFLTVAKQGSTMTGLASTIGILTSFALQHGVPLDALVEKMAFTKFEPSGLTGDPEFPVATSFIDYVFRWLGSRYGRVKLEAGQVTVQAAAPAPVRSYDSPVCAKCGAQTFRAGKCYTCTQCGSSDGCG